MIIRRLGTGGMGEVYAAFDEQLDRKVALKVLRRDRERGKEWDARLLREAQAMARLSHPNVVNVHEVGEHGDQMFIAMEFIAGGTLEVWLSAAPRRWQDIVAAFIDAGKGLHAAHQAGIIHRDFKPGNTMVGADGRVRVLDFGLAAPQHAPLVREEEADLMASLSASAFDVKLTLDGSVLGTPAFMSPEQISGSSLTPASDQFNFCVALYEALYRTHPFVDGPITLAKLRQAVVHGETREPPRSSGVPGWVADVLRRGLRTRPASRFSSMEALIAALERDPARRRRRILASVTLTACAALAGFALSASMPRDASTCDTGQAVIAALWNPQRREQIAAAFHATDLEFVDTTLASVTGNFDVYADDWAAMHRDACVDHREGTQSGAMLDARMICLERRRRALDGALDLLATADAAIVDGALRLVSDLPLVSHCGDLAMLAAEVPPPGDPAVTEQIEAQRRRLDAAAALSAVGREEEAVSISREVAARGRDLGFRPLAAEALLAQGRTLLDFGARPDEALPALNEALLAAIGTGMHAVAAEALARRTYVVGLQSGRVADALVDAGLAREFIGKLSTPGPLLWLLSNNIGAVHVAAGDLSSARAQFEEALKIIEDLPGQHVLDLSFTLANLAMQLDEGERREALLRRMVDVRQETLGEGHPLTAHGVILWALYTTDPRVAVARFERGCRTLDELPGDHVVEQRRCRIYLGHARAEAGDPYGAAVELRRALGLKVPGFDESAEGLEALATVRSYAAVFSRESDAAIPELRRALEELSREPGTAWWQRLDLAEAQLALALNLEAANADAEAVTLLDRLIPVLEALTEQRLEVALRQHLALAWFCRARALTRDMDASPSSRARAEHDILRAEAWYRGAGPGYAWRLMAIDRWRRSLPS